MGRETRWNERWLTPKAASSPSVLHDLGVRALRPIAKGETVAVLGGVVVPREEIDEYRASMTHVGVQISDRFFLCPTSREQLERTGVFNHSCEPNIGFADAVTFIAIADIGPGEELVFDYAFSETYFETFECGCRGAHHRRVVRPTDWQLPSIRERYGAYFSPYLQRRFTP